MYATQETSLETGDIAQDLFDTTGVTFWIDEERHMHDITAVSGSGPGFVFYLMECLEDELGRAGAINEVLSLQGEALAFYDAYLSAATALHIADADTTKEIVQQLFKGSALLAQQETQKTFAQLREAVTSPKGTTAAGLEVLMASRDDLAARIDATLRATSDRSRELA